MYDLHDDDEMPRDPDADEIPADVAHMNGKIVTANDGAPPALFHVPVQAWADARRAREDGLR